MLQSLTPVKMATLLIHMHLFTAESNHQPFCQDVEKSNLLEMNCMGLLLDLNK